jgi:hypothetical protein
VDPCGSSPQAHSICCFLLLQEHFFLYKTMPPKQQISDHVAEEPCDIDYGCVASELLAVLTADRKCLRCGHRVADHTISARPASATAAPLSIVVPSREEKKLAAMRDAQARSRAMRSSYVPDFREVPSIHLQLALRHANAGHLGVLGCPGLVVGHLPDQPATDLYVRPWVRARHLRRVVDAIDYSIAAHRHTTPRPSRDPLPRTRIFADARASAPDWSAAEVLELQRALKALSIGLAAVEDRDPLVFGKSYADIDMRLTHHAAGRLNPFVFTRTCTLDSLCAWLVALRDGVTLPTVASTGTGAVTATGPPPAAAAGAAVEGGGGGGRAAAAPVQMVDLEAWAREWPLIGLGHATTMGFGEASRATANIAWEALESAETFAIGELRIYFGATAAVRSGGDFRGGTSEVVEHQRMRKRLRSGSSGRSGSGGALVDRREGGAGRHLGPAGSSRGTAGSAAGSSGPALATPAPLDGATQRGSGSSGSATGSATGTTAGWLTPQQRLEAKARVASKAVDEITRTDCMDAQLCFQCKFPRHASGAPCVPRGRAF